MRLLLFFSLMTTLTMKAQNAFSPNDLKIDWQLVTNNHNGKEQFLATLTLTNTSPTTAMPASGWVIYYNGIRDVAKKDIGFGLVTERIHGDLFHLRPTATFRGLKPKESVVLQCVGQSWVFNISDAPSGYYWVWDETPSVTHDLKQVSARPPADIKKFKRSANQKNDQITPAMVFEQNKSIANISDNQLVKVFPSPVSYSESNGTWILTPSVTIAADPLFENEARYLSDEFSAFLNAKLNFKTGNQSGDVRLILNKNIEKEGYHLNINSSGIEIAASEPKGIFYGIQSLKCLMPLDVWKKPTGSISLPQVAVQDHPRFGYRGLHLDVARNFQTIEQIKRVINWMAMYKLNTLHFHFSEDDAWRIEIPALPELTTVGVRRGHTLDSKNNMPASYGSGGDIDNVNSRFYTRAEYIDLLKFAKSRHVEVIPEIETPGHARAAIKAMNARYDRLMLAGKPDAAKEYLLADFDDKSVYLSAQNFTDNVMCVALPSVYKFIETTLDAIIAMHNEAGMPLKTIHLGGDEVPVGAWEKSPLCQALLKELPTDEYKQTSDLWIYFWRKMIEITQKRGLYISGWEEIGMRESKIDGNRIMMVNPVFANQNFHTYVWNTVIGWGSEDLPYRLANSGYKVVLCPVSNLYFDLAYQKDFNEIGYYWGGFVDIDKPFYFIPYDYLKNTKVDRFGNPIDPKSLVGKDRLTDYGKRNIVGIQGHLWSENIRSAADLEYMAFPKVLALAERAWAADPDWATEKNARKSDSLYQKAWSQFVNCVGKRELFKLNYYQGGAHFRIPTVGAVVSNGAVIANIQLPGLDIRYTTDGTDPSVNSPLYKAPITVKRLIKLRAFDSKGRGGRTVEVNNK